MAGGWVDAFVGIPHDLGQFGMHDANQCLPGIERTNHLLAHRLFLDGGDKVLDHRQRNVSFEQCHTHFAQGIGDIGFGQASFALQRLHDARKACGQVVEHVRWASSRIREWPTL